MNAETVKPFARQGNYTVMDNAILDYVMPSLSPAAWKVLCHVLRQTVGWRRQSDNISYEQMMSRTGIGGRATIAKAISELSDSGIISAERGDGIPTLFKLNADFEINASSETELLSSETEPLPVQKLNTQNKEKQKTTNKPTEEEEGARTGSAEVFRVWQDNMPGTLSPILSEQIEELILETSPESVLYGIRQAVAASARKLTYVRACATRHAAGEMAAPRHSGNSNTDGKPQASPARRSKVDESLAAGRRVYEEMKRNGELT